ncbi:Hypothetical predicted protein [Mytilus galloprovincialis]|uniref:Uncharacterized protein n=2 Tax=Mytilus galloprovincialis TaxID=29158 RepID=A0A8B6DDY7_MYTGA|nr:Hypothetical predicted protein [Mytilus galloprovincialis]
MKDTKKDDNSPNTLKVPDEKEMPSATVRRSNSQRLTPKLKRGTNVGRSNSFNLLARPVRPGDRLNIERLNAFTPHENGRDLVSEASREILLNAMKMESHVHDIFFPGEDRDPVLDYVDTRGFPVEKLATALVAQAISRIKDTHRFHQMIDKTALDDVLRDIYNSLHWKKLGFTLYTLCYPDVVRDNKTGVCLRDFIEDNGHVWAERLLAHIMEPRWTKHWMFKIIRGQYSDEDYNKEMNALFVKLHLLDPQTVIPAFQFLLNQKALPVVNLELATRNYLGGPFDCALIENNVLCAEEKETLPVNTSRLSLSEVEMYFGTEVDDFIVTDCRNIGVWSGKRPENQKRSKPSERCSVM